MLGARVAGKYELKRLLGSGSTGGVYEGVHVDIGKRLAIKLLHAEFGETPEIVARFRREARAASAVESDYIAQIYDFGRDDKLGLYMVIEYLEGEDLEARLARERWISEREAATIGVQIGRGLSRAHGAGVVHRDLKPANIFLTQNDDGSPHVKLLDFGISKFEPLGAPSSVGEPTLTAHGTTMGTPEYMSPEQCEGLPDVDARADVWAMAAVLYEMLVGEPAIRSDGGHIAVMTRIVRDDIAPLASRASWVSPALAEAVDAGLVRDRARRIPDAMSFVLRLLAAVPDAGVRSSVGAMPAGRPTDVTELGDGPVTEAAPPPPGTPVGSRIVIPAQAAAPPAVVMADTGNPPSAEPPSSENPLSSTGEGVAIFSRGAVPQELLELRSRHKRSEKKDP